MTTLRTFVEQVDEARKAVRAAHQMRIRYGTAEACECGWVPPDVWEWHADHREHLTDAVLVLLNVDLPQYDELAHERPYEQVLDEDERRGH